MCLAGNFKWDRIRVETTGLFFLFILHHLPRTDCKSLCCVPVDVFEVEFYESTAEAFLPEQVFRVSFVDCQLSNPGQDGDCIHFSVGIITHLLRVCVCLIIVRLNIL